MNKSVQELIEYFDLIIEDCENFDLMTRDSALQRAACSRLQRMIAECEALKPQAVAADDEPFANLLLGFQCAAKCLRSEITMWLLLKTEQPDRAWDALVEAQMAAIGGVRAHGVFAHLIKVVARLETIEKLIFPPQVFISSGLIVHSQACSICGSEYGECEHLAGKPYWRQFCNIVVKEFEGDHVAMVDNPSDKRCRVIHFSAEGGERNRMTRKVEPSAESVASDKVEGEKSLKATVRILSAT